MTRRTNSGGGNPNLNSEQRPALDARERDVLGARLRHEHAEIVREPLPARIRVLLGELALKRRDDSPS